MLIDQADLLWGMDRLFIKNFMALSVNAHSEKHDVIFREGDKADHFYTLVEGRLRLSTGQPPKEICIIDKAGEAFGWSSLVDRNYYSATAECTAPSDFLQFPRDDLSNFLNHNGENAFIFYKRLAAMLGNRLIACYKLIPCVP